MKRIISIIIIFVIFGLMLLVAGYGTCACGLISPPPQTTPLTWKKITPGVTTLEEVTAIYGSPTRTITKNGLINLIYTDYPEFTPRTKMEILISKRLGKNVVVAVFDHILYLQIPVDRNLYLNDFVYLEQVVLAFGKPEKTTWSHNNLQRYLMWPEKGIAVIAEPRYSTSVEWNDLRVDGVLVFKPMNMRKFLCSSLDWSILSPFISPSSTLPPQIPDLRDIYPEDPYDWEHMPTPTP
jgi:hypothetical protein